MNQSQDTVQTAQAGLLQAQLVEIAHLVGRTPESFYAREERPGEGRVEELMDTWGKLSRQAQDRLLDTARTLRDSHGAAGSVITTQSKGQLTAIR